MTQTQDDVRQLFPGAPALPAMPPESMNPVLDAAARCFVRYGVKRTSVQDVAKEMGVNRSTVYRLVGNMDDLTLQLGIREAYRLLLLRAPARLARPINPEVVVDILVQAVADAREHPVLAKLLADERDLVGSWLSNRAHELVGTTAKVGAPLLAAGMRAGLLAKRDPLLVAEWLVRITASVVLVEQPGSVREFISAGVLPILTPEPAKA